jgi:uncharacterized protein (TIGR02284 family)
MHTIKGQTDRLNSLLRGELAAVETYQQALAKVDNQAGREELRRIHDEHRASANTIRQAVHEHGGQPDRGSGVWGAFAKAVAGAAKLLGNVAALKALKEGEEHGVKTYEAALEDKELSPDCKELIRSSLLPRTRAHLPVLDQLMKAC